MRLVATTCLFGVLAAGAFAAGSGSDEPPTPSETTTQCVQGQVFDIATQSCMSPEQSTNDDNASLLILRELAYAGRYDEASAVLETLNDQESADALTYRGFIARQTGDFETGLTYYQAALRVDPNHFNARSYMGQGYVAEGRLELAKEQLTEIRQRGGRGTWAEFSLRTAIDSGRGYSY